MSPRISPNRCEIACSFKLFARASGATGATAANPTDIPTAPRARYRRTKASYAFLELIPNPHARSIKIIVKVVLRVKYVSGADMGTPFYDALHCSNFRPAHFFCSAMSSGLRLLMSAAGPKRTRRPATVAAAFGGIADKTSWGH
jgi:hypothetical protein